MIWQNTRLNEKQKIKLMAAGGEAFGWESFEIDVPDELIVENDTLDNVIANLKSTLTQYSVGETGDGFFEFAESQAHKGEIRMSRLAVAIDTNLTVIIEN